MRISDWSSDVCSSDLAPVAAQPGARGADDRIRLQGRQRLRGQERRQLLRRDARLRQQGQSGRPGRRAVAVREGWPRGRVRVPRDQELFVQRRPLRTDRCPHSAAVAFTTRSEEHTSELQSLMRTSYAVFCLKKKKQ